MINLGDEVEDKITGFRGIAIARHFYLNGMTVISVQPQVEQYGILPDSENFYEVQLKVIKKYNISNIIEDNKSISDLVTILKKIKKD